MARLRRSNVRLSEITPRARHKGVIKAGNLSLQELDWAMEVIYPRDESADVHVQMRDQAKDQPGFVHYKI